MNKFLNRKVRPDSPEERKGSSAASARSRGKAYEELEEFASFWSSLEEARRKMRRSVMYAYEDQWGDPIMDYDTGETITEGEYIRRQGKVPLKNNMISPIVKNIDGQFRSNLSKTVCSVRDKDEAKVGEMMSIAIEYSHSVNQTTELDSNLLRLIECSGFGAQRIEYGFNESIYQNDAWIYNVEPCRLFFNPNIEDVRGWDITCIGELFDMPLDKVISAFAKSEQDRDRIESIYGRDAEERQYIYSTGLQGRAAANMSFYTPSDPDMCRVILGWKLESRDAYFYQDMLDGSWGYVGVREKAMLDETNRKRMQEASENGVSEEDMLLIEYEFRPERFWYYRYLTPWGDVLQEGRSPYWHRQHNYVLITHVMIQGKVFNFVEDFIDQQRSINRTLTLIDFIRSSSSKGVLIVDEDSFSSMSRKEIVDEYVRYNGVLFVRLKQGKSVDNVIKQLNGNGAVQGDYELLNLQLKLLSDISGVNSSMQGKDPSSGTAASLYAQQTQNASMNLKGLFESFKAFRKRRDVKLMQTIQQFYTSARYIDLAGSDYSEESKYYIPEKVQGAQIDIEVVEGTNTPVFQMLENEFLMQLFQQQAIGVKTLLENSSLPFASRILESVKRAEQESAGGNMGQMDPSVMSMASSMSAPIMASAMDDSNAGPEDGIVMKA